MKKAIENSKILFQDREITLHEATNIIGLFDEKKGKPTVNKLFATEKSHQ